MANSCGLYNQNGCTEPCRQCYEKVIAGVMEYACYGQCVVVDAYGHRHLGPGEAAPAGWTPSAGGSMAEMIADEIANINNSGPIPTSQLDCCSGGPCDQNCWTKGSNPCQCSLLSPGIGWKGYVRPAMLDRLTQTTEEEQKAALIVARNAGNFTNPTNIASAAYCYTKNQSTGKNDCVTGGNLCPDCTLNNCCYKNTAMNECGCFAKNPGTGWTRQSVKSRDYNNVLNQARNSANFVPTPTTTPNTFNITNNGSGNYLINGVSNATLSLTRGQTYTFNITAMGHPFWIKTVLSTGTGNVYNTGVMNNGMQNGTLTFVVPNNAPNTLYYNCQFHSSMAGTINIVNNTQTTTPTSASLCCLGFPSTCGGACWQRISTETGKRECKCLSLNGPDRNPNHPDSGGWTRFPRRAKGPIWA